MPVGIYALALAAFGIGLTEFGVVGLLPRIAADLAITEPVAGYLVSGYALSVAVGAIVLTAAVARRERRRVLLGLMVLFIAGNLISALAPTFETLMLGRIVAALCHGAFFGIGVVAATDMVERGRQAAAISLVFAGLSVSNVMGVPFGAFVGLELGWRSIFWALSGIGVLSMLGIGLLVPDMPVSADTDLRQEIGVLRRPQVWVCALLSVLAFAGVIGGYTYIAFTLTQVSGFAAATVPWLLVLFGLGTFIGNIVGGKVADRALDLSLGLNLALLAAVLALFALTAENQSMTLVSLILMGGVGLATAPGLQLRMVSHAREAPTVASGVNIAAFNLGNALGAGLGGAALGAGWGFASPLWVGAGLACAALIVLVAGSSRPGADRRMADEPT